MNRPVRIGLILRIALPISFFIILFFSGIFPFETLLSLAPQSSLQASVVAADVASLTNQNRTERGLPALAVNPLLTQAAQLKADDMAKNSYYAHTSPDGKSPLYWLNLVGYKYLNAGENLVIDRTTSEQAVDAWMDSPDHRENILRPQFTQVGVGVAPGEYQGIPTIYVVEEFGTPYPLSAPAQKPAIAPVATVPEPVKTLARSISAPAAKKPAGTAAATAVPSKEPALAEKASSAAGEGATTSIATSSNAAFTLAPEFFAPVSFASSADATGSREADPQGEGSAVRSGTWLQSLRAYILRMFIFMKFI